MSVVLALLAVLNLSSSATVTLAPTLGGTWRSAVEEMPLSSSFDESVWGKNAKSTRVVEMRITSTGDATLTVTRKILDAHGREIKPATSIEYAELAIAPAQKIGNVRSDLDVTVKQAERRYPDDPSATWKLDGLKITVSTFTDDPSRIEVRVDTPEGRGSFWETLRPMVRKSSTRR